MPNYELVMTSPEDGKTAVFESLAAHCPTHAVVIATVCERGTLKPRLLCYLYEAEPDHVQALCEELRAMGLTLHYLRERTACMTIQHSERETNP